MVTQEWEDDQAPLGAKVNQGAEDQLRLLLAILTPLLSFQGQPGTRGFPGFPVSGGSWG